MRIRSTMAVMCDVIVEILTQRHFLQNLAMVTGSRANIIWDQKSGAQMAEWMQERIACWTDRRNSHTMTTGGKLHASDTCKAIRAMTLINPNTVVIDVVFSLAAAFCVFIVVLAVFIVRRTRKRKQKHAMSFNPCSLSER